MATTNNQLLTYIQELRQLIDDELCQDQFFLQVHQNLDEIAGNLSLKKLSVNILSIDLELAKTFQLFLKSHQNLEKHYQFQVQQTPKQFVQKQAPPCPASLILQEAVDGAKTIKQTQYQLSSEPVLTVGRKPGCNINISDYCTHVSGRHLEVHFCLANDRDATPQWQVQNCDGCKNGTYINGEELLGSQTLKDGDRLILGNPLFSVKSPELIFESQDVAELTLTENWETQQFKQGVNHDIIFLVLDSSRDLLEQEQKLLALAAVTPLTEVFLAILLNKTFEIKAIVPQANASVVLEDFIQQLASIDEKRTCLKKTQRALVQIISNIDQISQLLLDKQEKVKQEVKKIEDYQSQGNKRDSGDDTSSLLKAIHELKANVSKAVEAELNQAKQDLLDDSLADSILYELQQLIDSLGPYVTTQRNQKYLELRTKGRRSNVNEFIVDFCESYLLDWTDEEWRKIRKEYGNGGLEGLIKTSSVILEPVCEKKGKTLIMNIKREIEVVRVFQAPLRKIPCKVEHREDPAWLYFVKKIRTSVFQAMGILFLLSFLGLSRTKVIRSINQQIANSIFLSILVLGIIIWLVCQLYSEYQKSKNLEVHKVSERIKQDLKNYYQKVIKNRFVDKLSQCLEDYFKEEINQFDENIRSLLNATGKNAVERRNDPVDSRSYLRDYQTQLTKLERKLRDFQRIKIKLQRNSQDLSSM